MMSSKEFYNHLLYHIVTFQKRFAERTRAYFNKFPARPSLGLGVRRLPYRDSPSTVHRPLKLHAIPTLGIEHLLQSIDPQLLPQGVGCFEFTMDQKCLPRLGSQRIRDQEILSGMC